ncbi:MAG: DUF6448 family protein [Smithellaceae bacterium]
MNTCHDTINDSVVKTRQAVFKKRNVTPMLKLVKNENEKKINNCFKKTLSKGNKRKKAQVVVASAVIAADNNLEIVSEDMLIKLITGKVTKDIRECFAKVKEARKHADQSAEAYREYMTEYNKFTHRAERYTLMLKCIQDVILGSTSPTTGDQHKHKKEDRHIPVEITTRQIKPGAPAQSRCSL